MSVNDSSPSKMKPEWKENIQDTLGWDWEVMCGPNGFVVWSPEIHNFGLCFQEICLHLPVLIFLAILSSYHFGFRSRYPALRNSSYAFQTRKIATIILAMLPLIKLFIGVTKTPHALNVVDYFMPLVVSVTWLSHFCYVCTVKRGGNSAQGGQIVIYILWTTLVVVDIMSVQLYYCWQNIAVPAMSEYMKLSYGISITVLVFQCIYGVCLLCDGRTQQQDFSPEQQALLGSPRVHSYSRFREEDDPLYLGVALEGWSFLSRMFFIWVNPLMDKGVKGKLNQPDDLHDLPLNLTPAYLSNQLEYSLNCDENSEHQEQNNTAGWYGSINSGPASHPDTHTTMYSRKIPRRKVTLLRALHSCFGLQFYGIGILKFIADCSGFVGPLLLNALITFIETKSENIEDGYAYAAGLFGATFVGALCNAHFNFLMATVGLKIRGAIVSIVYRKTLMVSTTSLNKFGIGEIVNFMSTDTDRIVNACPSFHAFWSIPFQIAVTLYLLYLQVGYAFLAGVLFTVVLIPINKFLASKIGELSTKMMASKDKRVQMMAEVLKGITVLKFHVWENNFINKINVCRDEELKYLKYRKYLDALCVYFWATTPVLMSILTFSTYALLGNKLTAATVFTSIALLNMLIAPLNAFPWVLNGLTEAWVSLNRIQKLLELSDLDFSEYYTSLPSGDTNVAVYVKEGTFAWSVYNNEENSVNADEPSQSTVLSNIDLIVAKGEFVGVTGRVGSGKSTVLSALLAELNKVAGVVCLDNVDSGFGFVSQLHWLQHGTLRDNILFGKAYDDSKYKAVLEACCLEEDIKSFPGGDLIGVGEGGVTLSGGQKARVALARAVYQNKDVYFLDDIFSAVDNHVAQHLFRKCITGLLRNKTRILCTHHVKYLMFADKVVIMDNGAIKDQGKPQDVLPDYDEFLSSSDYETFDSSPLKTLVESKSNQMQEVNESDFQEEEREVGTIDWSVYGAYWKAIGHFLAAFILLSIIFMQSSRNLTDLWLSYWVSHSGDNQPHSNDDSVAPRLYHSLDKSNVKYYLTVYGILACCNSVFTLFRAFLFAFGGVHAATKIHKSLLSVIIKMTAYRTLAVTVYALPWLILLLAPLVPVYHWLQNHYRLTSRELKRLSSLSLSPVYSHFNETVMGLATIRAFRAIPRFKRENEEHLEANQKCQLASQAASQWLGLRLQLIGVAMVTGIGIIAVVQHQFDAADAGLIGLALSYALSVTGILSGVVNAFTETEREMIAVERIQQYINHVEPENVQEILPPPYAWPSQGVITFSNVVLKYRDHLAPALNGVSFETRPAEKIGVMGRTGAGKSSLLVALFRLCELFSGKILIDTVDISHIGLHGLRVRLAVIPQDPFLFSGSIRENLDPASEYRDDELMNVIQRCHMAAAVRKLGGLEAKLSPGGSNLSVGQRQLLCLIRAVLHNAKIVCIDEATASVDLETDRNIQHTLRTSFRQSTVISIAHRASTIMDLDRVLVLGNGEVLEFDSPDVLMRNKESHFYKLASPEYELS
ncbi:Multidrug resistance protein homolog 65 [Gryllus bimaculatus]|nr:Multidrug resistance protein homolog 65 [Gryllus bimaculatus]